jgi:hypothetical protein
VKYRDVADAATQGNFFLLHRLTGTLIRK